mmetsp:Transcript_32096/g.85927  ORF Transcript_32096/g.85927 Transcript_32096/m.85927 type:complete len:127 (-) Transcript_32096:3222-3602(-)
MGIASGLRGSTVGAPKTTEGAQASTHPLEHESLLAGPRLPAAAQNGEVAAEMHLAPAVSTLAVTAEGGASRVTIACARRPLELPGPWANPSPASIGPRGALMAPHWDEDEVMMGFAQDAFQEFQSI